VAGLYYNRRLLITGFDTRLASASSVARAAYGRVWLARARGIRIGMRPRELRGPCRLARGPGHGCARVGPARFSLRTGVLYVCWRSNARRLARVINPPTDGRRGEILFGAAKLGPLDLKSETGSDY
jgi:hypothetical protein